LLNKIMEHFIEKEEYEQCADVRDLILTLSIPQSKPKRKYTKRKVKTKS
jgi:protein-arginine kinase activator protein McsA